MCLQTLLGHSKELFKFEDKNKAVITVFGHSLAGAQGNTKELTSYNNIIAIN